MYCKKCNSVLNETDKFCKVCGTMVEGQNVETPNQYNSSIEPTNSGVGNEQTNNVNSISQNPSYIQNDNSTIGYSNDVNQNQQNQTNQNTISPDTIPNSKPSHNGLISMILGIASVVLSFVLNIFIMPVAVVGLILGLIEKQKSSKKTAGIILNIVALVLPIIILIIGGIALIDDFSGDDNNKVFSGEGYKLTYDNDWVSGTVSEKKALSYTDADNSYFLPIGKSALSEFSCDFDESTCKTKLYNEFYDMWGKSLNQSSLYLYKDSYSLNLLKDDIYYGTYNYGKSSTDLRGKYYLLVSKEKNVVLSFMTNSNANDVEEISEEVLEMFRTIEIEKNTSVGSSSNNNSDENVIYDDELYEMLDSMSNWNRYSSLRTGNLGKVAYITGGWRILSDSETYWEFKNGEFWWYKSVNDLNDNYWYGTTKILTGKEGLKSVGLDESKVDNIVSRSNGSVSASDIYAVVCTPTKIISGGEDKSATNIPADAKWNYVWVVVDHGQDGIEGQVVNVDSAETTYYVKIKD